MQGVQISNSGQQVDARARTNGRVHAVLQHPQTAALTVRSGGHEQVRLREIMWLSLPDFSVLQEAYVLFVCRRVHIQWRLINSGVQYVGFREELCLSLLCLSLINKMEMSAVLAQH